MLASIAQRIAEVAQEARDERDSKGNLSHATKVKLIFLKDTFFCAVRAEKTFYPDKPMARWDTGLAYNVNRFFSSAKDKIQYLYDEGILQ